MKRPQQERYAGTPDEFTVNEGARRAGGAELFFQLTDEEQDAAVGPAVAEKLRAGEITLADLVQTTDAGDAPGFLVQKPLGDL